MEIPDIIGYSLREALKLFESQNIIIDSVRVTSAPRLKSSEYDDSYRIVRIDLTEGEKIKLLVCKPL